MSQEPNLTHSRIICSRFDLSLELLLLLHVLFIKRLSISLTLNFIPAIFRPASLKTNYAGRTLNSSNVTPKCRLAVKALQAQRIVNSSFDAFTSSPLYAVNVRVTVCHSPVPAATGMLKRMKPGYPLSESWKLES